MTAYSRAELERLAAKIENWPANGKPEYNDDLHLLLANNFVSTEDTKEPCRTCGTPRVTHRYMKVTQAGRLFLNAMRSQS